jgi:hypothetical protein
MSLSSVLGKVGVYEMNKIIPDWNGEDSWHGNLVLDFDIGSTSVVD